MIFDTFWCSIFVFEYFRMIDVGKEQHEKTK